MLSSGRVNSSVAMVVTSSSSSVSALMRGPIMYMTESSTSLDISGRFWSHPSASLPVFCSDIGDIHAANCLCGWLLDVDCCMLVLLSCLLASLIAPDWEERGSDTCGACFNDSSRDVKSFESLPPVSNVSWSINGREVRLFGRPDVAFTKESLSNDPSVLRFAKDLQKARACPDESLSEVLH